MYALENRCVWLTGASSGIGEGLAKELARRGSRVALTARRADALEKLVIEITQNGGNARAYPGDVLDLEAMKSIAKSIERDIAPIDLLIANAGTHVFTKPEDFDSREYLDLMSINFGGMLKCIEAVLPSMLARGTGYISAVASLAGYRGLPRAAAYGASKAAMIHFLESIRFHLRPKGIKVSVINPGFVKTPLTDKNDFYMPFLIDCDRAARYICDGLEREKRKIAFPPAFSWILEIGRVIPAPIYERIVDKLW